MEIIMSAGIKLTVNQEEYYFVKNYRDNNNYRQSFNNLTRKIYGFDFEEWYQQGFWQDKYNPYSLIHKDEVIANASVNKMDFQVDGEIRHIIQIGTVMTEEAYRKKGLSKILIDLIIKEYEDQCDLIYLFANDSVLEFYPKFGFSQTEEYEYSRWFTKKENELASRKLDMKDENDKKIINRLVSNTLPVSEIAMIGNMGLVMFYLISFMSDHIYYIKDLELAVVAEIEEDILYVKDIFCEKYFDLNEVINTLMRKDNRKVILCFTPLDTSLYFCEIRKEANTTLFIRGKNILGKGMFPALSHA